MDKKFLSVFDRGVRVLFLLLIIFTAVTAFFNRYVFAAELVLLAAAYIYYVRASRERMRDVARYIDALSINVDSAAKSSLISFPLAMCFVRSNGTISWCNDKFADAVASDEYLFERNVAEFLPGVDAAAILSGELKSPIHTQVGKRSYDAYINLIPTGSKTRKIITLYLVDQSELADVKKQLLDRRCVVGLAMIDNYDEIMQNVKELEKANAVAMVDRRLSRWAEQADAFIMRYERDKYIFVMEEPYLEEIIKGRFSILESVKDIVVGANKMPITISISVGRGSNSFAAKYDMARTAIEVALGRGGDQAVIKTRDRYEYFGGMSKEVEKRTKVKSRVVATALRELMRDCGNVIIMGHSFADIDSVGASVGICRIAKNFGKEANIVVSKRSEMVTRMIEKLEANPLYEGVFVQPQAAMSLVGDKTLLVIVDTHNPDYVDSRTVLEACARVVVIDHHRRGANFVENPSLVFHEPYASSACEMVTEILSYLDDSNRLIKEEANMLLAGIILDTKSFTMKTGVRTFEAASYLKRAGADTIDAKLLFRTDMESYQSKIAFISAAETYRDVCVIAASENEDGRLTKETFAQSVDEMLNISDVRAAFGLAVFGEQVHVSARSYGAMNVQTILEKLGGGGHQTVAGAQISGATLDEVREKLQREIDEVLDSERLPVKYTE